MWKSNTSTGARPDRKVRFILGEPFDRWSWQPNDRMWFWLDGIESCCGGVEGSSKRICVRRFSPSALSFFRFHLSPFPPETPDTQATTSWVLNYLCDAWSGQIASGWVVHDLLYSQICMTRDFPIRFQRPLNITWNIEAQTLKTDTVFIHL